MATGFAIIPPTHPNSTWVNSENGAQAPMTSVSGATKVLLSMCAHPVDRSYNGMEGDDVSDSIMRNLVSHDTHITTVFRGFRFPCWDLGQ